MDNGTEKPKICDNCGEKIERDECYIGPHKWWCRRCWDAWLAEPYDQVPSVETIWKALVNLRGLVLVIRDQVHCGAKGHKFKPVDFHEITKEASFRCEVCGIKYFRHFDELTSHEKELVQQAGFRLEP